MQSCMNEHPMFVRRAIVRTEKRRNSRLRELSDSSNRDLRKRATHYSWSPYLKAFRFINVAHWETSEWQSELLM